MRCLVTGGGGFIGSHLVRRLLALDHQVVIVDHDALSAVRRLNGVFDDPRLHFIEVDVRRVAPADVGPVDIVFHLAAKVGVLTAAREGLAVLEWNMAATRAALRLAQGADFLFASSSEVYGDTEQPAAESFPLCLPPPTNPRWAYAYGKAVDEMIVLHDTGLKRCIVARLFNVVGVQQNETYGAVLPSFVRAALDGTALVVHGDGEQTRSFLHVDDTIDALARLGNCLPSQPTPVAGIYNVGSNIEISMRALAHEVVSLTRSRSVIRHERAADAALIGCRRRWANMTKLAALDWWPSQTLGTAIDEIIVSMRGTK